MNTPEVREFLDIMNSNWDGQFQFEKFIYMIRTSLSKTYMDESHFNRFISLNSVQKEIAENSDTFFEKRMLYFITKNSNGCKDRFNKIKKYLVINDKLGENLDKCFVNYSLDRKMAIISGIEGISVF